MSPKRNYIPLRGEGNVGRRGGPAGDLIVMIEEEPHPLFTREGDNIILDLLVTFSEAALGADIEVPTLTGRARLKIEPGTQSGTILRMREKGLPRLNSFSKGDQFVRVNVWVPEDTVVAGQDAAQAACGVREHEPGRRSNLGERGEELLVARRKEIVVSGTCGSAIFSSNGWDSRGMRSWSSDSLSAGF